MDLHPSCDTASQPVSNPTIPSLTASTADMNVHKPSWAKLPGLLPAGLWLLAWLPGAWIFFVAKPGLSILGFTVLLLGIRHGIAKMALVLAIALGLHTWLFRPSPPPPLPCAAKSIDAIEGIWLPALGKHRDLDLAQVYCPKGWRPLRGTARVFHSQNHIPKQAASKAPWPAADTPLGARMRFRVRSIRPIDPHKTKPANTHLHYRVYALAGVVVGQSPTGALNHAIDKIRKARLLLAQKLRKNLPPTAAWVVAKLSLGGTLARDLRPGNAGEHAWRDAGAIHLLAVSGLHMAIIAALIHTLLRSILAVLFLPWSIFTGRWPKLSPTTIAAIATLAALTLCVVWVRSPASALRASIMAGIAFLALITGRKTTSWNSWFFAAVVMLAIAPSAWRHPGIQLSFAATAGLLCAAKKSKHPLPGHTLKLWQRCLKHFQRAFFITLTAWIWTFPVLACHFGRVSWISPLANLVWVPYASMIVAPLALIFALCLGVMPHPPEFLTELVVRSITLLDSAIAWIAAWPVAATSMPAWPLPMVCAHYLVCILWQARPAPKAHSNKAPYLPPPPKRSLPVRRVQKLYALAAALALASLPTWHPMRSELIFPYVGQGDAAILKLAGGGVMLLDGGPNPRENPASVMRFVQHLQALNINRIHRLVVSHAHPDHIGGLIEIAKTIPIDVLWWPGCGNAAMQSLIQAVEKKGGQAKIPPLHLRWHGLDLEFLHPRIDGRIACLEEFGLNDNSLVLRIQHQKTRMLFAGDIEELGEERLVMQQGQALKADLLKVPHHGSKTSSGETFLAAVQPQTAIFNVGVQNRFGFPHPKVWQRYPKYASHRCITDPKNPLRFVLEPALHPKASATQKRCALTKPKR